MSRPDSFPVEVVTRPLEMPIIAEAGQLALEVEGSDGHGGAPVPHTPPERVVAQGTRRIRYVQVHERLDLSFVDPGGGQVRFRISLLPTQSPSLNV